MPRFFNTSGPNNPADSYTLPVSTRLPEVRRLVDQKLYFVLHAPRQVGKTTTLLTLAQEHDRESHPGRPIRADERPARHSTCARGASR